MDEPEQSVSFFRPLETHTKHRDVFVDLSQVERITPDAIAFLLAIVGLLSQRRLRVSGNYPVNPSAMGTIRASGFDQYIKTNLPGTGRSAKGAIVRQDLSLNSKRADGHYASQLVDFAGKGDTDRLRLKIAYSHLIECMGNTHQHAGDQPGDKPWWASVYRDARRKCDCFTFVDMGVGIFSSIELSLRLKMFNLSGWLKPKILKELLLGKIPSSTGRSYRGRGLPSIYDSCVERKIERLVIITNDVYADTAIQSFRTLPQELQGVVLYWEVNHEGS